MPPQPPLSLPEQMASHAALVVGSVLQTVYQHVEQIDVDRGAYLCDCNGFVSFTMQRAAPAHYAMIPKEATQLRPRAFEYYVFLSSLTPTSTGGWHRIQFLRDARRGDIIAWRFPVVEVGHDTGHVLIVAETPITNPSGTVTVPIYDSSAQPHFNDTRGSAQGAFPTGVGAGSINFQVDDMGRPTAFQFAPGDTFAAFPIAIGRLEPLPPGS